jgi:hypothetical protein
MVGTIISPAADQYITYLKKISSTPYQIEIEDWFPFPRPHGIWKTGRLVLRQGDGRRIISFSGVHTTDVYLLAPTRFLGDLMLECLPARDEWRIDFDDTAVRSRWAA